MFKHRKPDKIALLGHLGKITAVSNGLEICDGEKVLYGSRWFPEAVHQLLQHIVPLLLGLDTGDPLVNIQLLHLVFDIALGDKSVHIQVNGRFKFFLLLPLALLFFYRLIEHLTVEIIADRLHVAVLLRSQQVSGSPDLQIPHRDLEAAAKIRKFPDRMKTLLRHFFQHFISLIHEEGVGGTVGTAHPAPELIELG